MHCINARCPERPEDTIRSLELELEVVMKHHGPPSGQSMLLSAELSLQIPFCLTHCAEVMRGSGLSSKDNRVGTSLKSF